MIYKQGTKVKALPSSNNHYDITCERKNYVGYVVTSEKNNPVDWLLVIDVKIVDAIKDKDFSNPLFLKKLHNHKDAWWVESIHFIPIPIYDNKNIKKLKKKTS